MQHQTMAPRAIDEGADRAVADERQVERAGLGSAARVAAVSVHGRHRDANDFSAGCRTFGQIYNGDLAMPIAARAAPRSCDGLVCSCSAVARDCDRCVAAARSDEVLNLQLRFLVAAALTLVVAAYFALPLMDRLTLRWFARDLNMRGTLVTNALSDSIADALERREVPRLQALFDRAVQDERLVAIGLCSLDGTMLRRTASFPRSLTASRRRPRPSCPTRACASPAARSTSACTRSTARPGPIARLVLLHDLSFIDRRSQDTRQIPDPLHRRARPDDRADHDGRRAAELARLGVRRARPAARRRPAAADGMATPEMAPLAAEIRARACATWRTNTGARQGPQTDWDPERLRALLRTQLHGDQVIVVSNREPYIHERRPDGVVVRRPASGLVTAVEPVMRACSGTWIAHGSGSADRDGGRQARPRRRAARPATNTCCAASGSAPRKSRATTTASPTKACGRCATSPTCGRCSASRTGSSTGASTSASPMPSWPRRAARIPVVLVQDYHFALLPAMIRARLPRATILTFWHIPWPNPESFGICPWRREILEGMLGSTILGFHTRFHCKNFIETVDRYLEARIEHEHSTISFKGDETLVESYPISIEWPSRRKSAPPGRRRRVPAPRVRAPGLPAGACLGRRRRPLRLHQGHPRAAARGRAPAREAPGVDRPVHLRPGGGARRAACSTNTERSRNASRASPSASTSASAGPATSRCTCSPQHHEHDAVNELFRACRHLRGHQPARRHEPGLQGVRRGARRRAGRAGPQPLRRRRARNDRGADRQSRTTSRRPPTRCIARRRCRRPNSASAWRACA